MARLRNGIVSYGLHRCFAEPPGPPPTSRRMSLEHLILIQPDGRRITMVNGKIVEV